VLSFVVGDFFVNLDSCFELVTHWRWNLLGCDTFVVRLVSSFLEPLWSSEMLRTTDPMTQYHIPRDLNLLQYWCENLKSHK